MRDILNNNVTSYVNGLPSSMKCSVCGNVYHKQNKPIQSISKRTSWFKHYPIESMVRVLEICVYGIPVDSICCNNELLKNNNDLLREVYNDSRMNLVTECTDLLNERLKDMHVRGDGYEPPSVDSRDT